MRCAIHCDTILEGICLEANKSCNATVMQSVLQLYKNVQGFVSESRHLLEQSYSNASTEMARDFLTNLENKTIVLSPNLFQSISGDIPPTDL